MGPHATAQHFELIDLHPAPTDVTKAVIDGLNRSPKQLPAWLLYDRQGSALFDAICQQPEYTLTRLEKELLGTQAQAIAEALPASISRRGIWRRQCRKGVAIAGCDARAQLPGHRHQC